MAKVGSIKAYHNGAAYDVADICDQKISVFNKTFFDTTDATVLLYPQPPNLLVDACGKITSFDPSARADYGDVVSTANAKFNYSFTSNRSFSLSDSEKSAFAFGSTNFTVDGWYFVNPDETSNTTFSFCEFRNSTSLMAKDKVRRFALRLRIVDGVYALEASYGLVTAASMTATLDAADFTQPFHIAFVFTKDSTNSLRRRLFFNGNLVASDNSYTSYMNFSSPVLRFAFGQLGSNYNYYCNGIYLSMWRYSKIARWTENFTPPSDICQIINSTVSGNIPIRHNNQTYYVPLIAAKTPPCLAVRHNNQTYYTVRS